MTWLQSIGVAVSAIGLAVLGLKLAALWGSIGEKLGEHGRKLDKLEKQAEGVPDEVEGEVSKQYELVEGEVDAFRKNLTQLYRAHRHLRRELEHLKWHCGSQHGPVPTLAPADDDLSDSVELPPAGGVGGKHESEG